MTTGLGVISILDPERCWREWIRLGSLHKVQNKFEDEGLRNPRTLRVPTISAIEKAAYRWALENLEEAKKDLEYAWNQIGEVLTEERWQEFLVDKAKLAYFVQPKKIERFLEQHQLEYA